MSTRILYQLAALSLPILVLQACAVGSTPIEKKSLAQQRAMLDQNTKTLGYGPQSPRDIDRTIGLNPLVFSLAPDAKQMNLCNIHLHKNAEHKGGEFTTYAGDGDGHGYDTGYKYSGQLTAAERAPLAEAVCPSEYSAIQSGDTLEVHYVYSTSLVKPGATLGACVANPVLNPQLRVEGQVIVAVNDDNATDFMDLAKYDIRDKRTQAINIPTDTGVPVQYVGSTTGPNYNEQGSPYNVTWSLRPQVKKVNIKSIGKWCERNVFDEDHAHGVPPSVKIRSAISSICICSAV